MTTLEEAENQVKVLRAKKRLAELEGAFQEVKKEVLSCETIDDLVKVMSRYVAKINNARSVIRHTQE